MATTYNPLAWNETSGVASNSGADAGIGTLADSSSPDAVDNWIRGLMAAVKNQILDTEGGLAAGGTANAITLTSKRVLSSGHVAAGAMFAFRATATNTGAVTFAPDGLSAVAIVDAFGNALTGGEIVSGMMVGIMYNANTANWRLLNPAAGGKPRFSASTSSSQTSISSATKINFATEAFDIGGHYDNSTNYRWTPPAGLVWLHAELGSQFTADEAESQIYIYKNGSSFRSKYYIQRLNLLNNTSMEIMAIDRASGTDYYEIFVVGDGNTAIGGAFEGVML